MDRPFTAVAYAAAIAAGVFVFAIMPPSWQGDASAADAAAQSTPPPSTVSVGGVTLRSVNVDFPNRDRQFEGPGADVVNNNCLTCHSAGMVLTQPRLPRAVWQAEVEKMRNTYKAPVDAEDVPAIVDYLANLPH
jgi:cytochrome c5